MGTTIWSPLASGVLTGKYNDGIPENSRMSLPGYEWLRSGLESPEGRRRLEKVRTLTGIADELGISMTNMALAWCVKNPHVSTVILGASRASQLVENLECLEAVGSLTQEIMDRIGAVLDEE